MDDYIFSKDGIQCILKHIAELRYEINKIKTDLSIVQDRLQIDVKSREIEPIYILMIVKYKNDINKYRLCYGYDKHITKNIDTVEFNNEFEIKKILYNVKYSPYFIDYIKNTFMSKIICEKWKITLLSITEDEFIKSVCDLIYEVDITKIPY